MQHSEQFVGNDNTFVKNDTQDVVLTAEDQKNIREYNKEYNKKTTHKEEKKETTKLPLDANVLDIRAYGHNILVRPYGSNPFDNLQVTEDGLITSVKNGGRTKNKETGLMEDKEAFVLVGTVYAVGDLVEDIQVGEEVYYTKPSQTPIPFLHLGLWTIPDSRVMAVVSTTDHVSKRRKK